MEQQQKLDTDGDRKSHRHSSKTSKSKPPTQHQKIWRFLKGKIVVNAGEKGGGNGKSYVFDKLLSYILSIQQDEEYLVFDCDRSNPTTWLYYHDVMEIRTTISFTEDESENFLGDELVEQIVAGKSPILMDTPSQLARALADAYFNRGLQDSAKAYNFSFIFFYISPCDRHSLTQFTKILRRFGADGISWILVKNLYRTKKEDWEELLKEKSLVSALKNHSVVQMYMPELKRPEITMIEKQTLSFDKAIKAASLCGQTRLLKYQSEFFNEFEAAFLALIEQQQ